MPESFPGNSAELAATAPAAPARNVRWALLGVMLAMLLAMLDNTIVGTSLPTIVRGLGGLNQLSWVVSAYLLATAASTPVWESSVTCTAGSEPTSPRSLSSWPDRRYPGPRSQ
jgi:hypothetical protein